MTNAEYERGMAESQGDGDIMLGVCVQRIESLEKQLAETHACLTEAKTYPPVLDACCGTRSFWFDRKDARAVFVDRRRETHEKGPYKSYPSGQHIIVDPDQIADFTALPFPSGIFDHVVFDPPHMVKIGDTSYTALKYGKLEGDWRDMLRQGFAECFRVLRPGGTLIFKWCEYDVPVSEVLALTPEKPLYGHRSGKQSKTHWIAFLKPNGHADGSAGADTVRRDVGNSGGNDNG